MYSLPMSTDRLLTSCTDESFAHMTLLATFALLKAKGTKKEGEE
jgi:hypothetical protein